MELRIAGLNQMAVRHYRMGLYNVGIDIGNRALDLARQHLSDDHPGRLAILNNLAKLYQATGDYAAAEPVYRQMLEIERRTVGEAHEAYLDVLNSLAKLYHQMANYTAAEALYTEALATKRRTLPASHPDLAPSLNNLGLLCYDMGNYTGAKHHYLEARDIVRAALGEDHPDVAFILSNLGTLYHREGNYATAEALYQQMLAIRRAALPGDAPVIATSLNKLAALYRDMGRYAAADPLLRQALAIQLRAYGDGRPVAARTLHTLGLLYQEMGRYVEAEQLLRQALAIRGAWWSERHPEVAGSLNSLAMLYYDMGDYTSAESRAREALDLRLALFDPHHPDVGTSLNALALVKAAQGDYAAADMFYWQASAVKQDALGENHPDIAAIRHNQGLLYMDVGDYAMAEAFLQQALEIRRSALGERHHYVGITLAALAALFLSRGEYDTSEQHIQQAIEIERASPSRNDADLALYLNEFGVLHSHRNNFAKAEPFLHQSLEIQGRLYGEDSPIYATGLNNLGTLYYSMGNYPAAELLLRQSLEIRRRRLGDQHPDVVISLNNLAPLLASMHREDEALTASQEAATILDQTIGHVFSFSSERQRMQYLQILRTAVAGFLSLVCAAPTPAAVQTGLDLVLRRKALSAEALMAQRDAVVSRGDSALRAKLQELAGVRRQLAATLLAGPGAGDLAAHQEQLSAWNAQREILENELALQIPEIKLDQQLQAVNRQAIAAALPAGSVLIEFVRIPIFDPRAAPARGRSFWGLARYLAFTLPADAPEDIAMIDLGEAEPIDQLIAAFRTAIIGEPEPAGARRNEQAETLSPNLSHVSTRSWPAALRSVLTMLGRHLGPRPEPGARAGRAQLGMDLRQKLFDPLAPTLNGCTCLFLAPDGNLAQLPFEALPLADDRYLIDEYAISYLSVGRDAVRFGAAAADQPASPMVIADPDFDLAADPSAERGSSAVFQRLDGTRREGEAVGTLLGVEPKLAGAALESAVKACRSPRILHIATHGFFLPASSSEPGCEQTELAGFTGSTAQRMIRLSSVPNPLLRSGMVLAGVNTWLGEGAVPEAAEDGFLTAEDVTGLDLLATELVVLSACETGLGDIQVSEGVFGLRRAFVLAGAKTLVMSLWKVPDSQTQELMVKFYQRLLAGQPRAEALRAAQRALKEHYPDPYFWGAFICQGDPGPLPSPSPGAKF
jgi:CHAT domain-containing protein/tetratricopeptide (TPR) repeat protein